MHLWQGVLSLCVGNRKKREKEKKAKKNKNGKAATRIPPISTDRAAGC
jgi:hypothetical protein